MAESSHAEESIDDLIECCICNEIFDDPRMLPCIHTFCLDCLTKAGHSKSPENTMPCPVCRQEFKIPSEGFKGLAKNFFMQRLIDVNKTHSGSMDKLCDICTENENGTNSSPPAVVYCIECKQNICENCHRDHKRITILRSHELVELKCQGLTNKSTEQYVQSFCDQHQKEPFEMYCCKCELPVCRVCFAKSHRMHQYCDVNTITADFGEQMKTLADKVSDCLSESVAKVKEFEEKTGIFLSEIVQNEADIILRTSYIKCLIDKHEQQLIDDLNLLKAKRLKNLETARDEMNGHVFLMNSFIRDVKEMLDKGSTGDICRSMKTVVARANDLMQMYKTVTRRCSLKEYHVAFMYHDLEDVLECFKVNIVGRVTDDVGTCQQQSPRSQMDKIKADLALITKDRNTTRDEIMKLNGEKDRISNELTLVTIDRDVLIKTVSMLEVARDKQIGEVDAFMNELENVRKEQMAIKAENDKLTDKVTRSKNEGDQIREELILLKQENAKLKGEMTRVKTEKEKIKEKLTSLTSERNELQMELSRVEQAGIDQVIGELASVKQEKEKLKRELIKAKNKEARQTEGMLILDL